MSSISYLSSQTSSTAINTSTSTTSSTSTDLSADKTAFLKILTTQLQNQDPTNPVDTTEFTNQLISYSQLEQLMNLNTSNTEILSASKEANNLSAFSYIGSDVTTLGSSSVLQDGEAEWTYALPSDAANVTVQVTDADGNTVYTKSLTDVSSGTYDLKLTSDDLGTTATNGNVYKVSVVATDSAGSSITSELSAVYTVTGIQSDSDGVTLLAGNLTASASDITSLNKQAA